MSNAYNFMKSHQLLVLIFSLWICFTEAGAVEMSSYEGTCHNVTGNAGGYLKIIFSEENNKLSGCMLVSGWLGGGGNISGVRNGTNYLFTTTHPSGAIINWQGSLQNEKLSGEYFVPAQGDLPREVGEWSVNMKGHMKPGGPFDVNVTMVLLKMILEVRLNEPVKQASGTYISGAENVFKAVHPAGTGLSIWVENVDVDWKAESQGRDLEDIHKIRVNYTLFWKGILQPTGTTRLRLAYNAKIDAITSHEVIESTGTTNKEFNEIAFGVGALLGKAAVERFLGGN